LLSNIIIIVVKLQKKLTMV